MCIDLVKMITLIELVKAEQQVFQIHWWGVNILIPGYVIQQKTQHLPGFYLKDYQTLIKLVVILLNFAGW